MHKELTQDYIVNPTAIGQMLISLIGEMQLNPDVKCHPDFLVYVDAHSYEHWAFPPLYKFNLGRSCLAH